MIELNTKIETYQKNVSLFFIFSKRIICHVSKIVAIEPVSLIPSAEEALHTFANEVVMYPDIPADDEEIVRRIGDADAVLLSYTSSIRREVMERCLNIKYIGMCCSLYSPESANVDIIYANEHGIKVTGIRDYGDEGVVEYVISELVRCFHGFGQPAWEGEVREITGLKAGINRFGQVRRHDCRCTPVLRCGNILFCSQRKGMGS